MPARKIIYLSVILSCFIAANYSISSSDSEMKANIKDSLAFGVPLDVLAFDARNYVEDLSTGKHFAEGEMQAALEKIGMQASARTRYYGEAGKPPFACSALGTDDAHHFEISFTFS